MLSTLFEDVSRIAILVLKIARTQVRRRSKVNGVVIRGVFEDGHVLIIGPRVKLGEINGRSEHFINSEISTASWPYVYKKPHKSLNGMKFFDRH